MLENHHTVYVGVLLKLCKLSLNASSAGGLTWDAFRDISQGIRIYDATTLEIIQLYDFAREISIVDFTSAKC